jgi:hypothetical protein
MVEHQNNHPANAGMDMMEVMKRAYPQLFCLRSTRKKIQSLILAHGVRFIKIYETVGDLWIATEERMAIDFGLNMLTGVPTSQFPLFWTAVMADCWLCIELKIGGYVVITEFLNRLEYFRAINDIFEGGIRQLLSFYRKRGVCDCLENLYQNTKHLPKKSQCCFCMLIVERTSMMTCGCNSIQYCSEKCQRLDWDQHKSMCMFVRALLAKAAS